MTLLGNRIKFLLAQRKLTAKELAHRVNLSETSISKLVNGITKPRQANFTRIIQELCEKPEEVQQLLAAYAQIDEELEDEQQQMDPEVYQRLEEDRVRSYLQAKSQSIAFREQVAVDLQQSGVTFLGPHQHQEIICDFFVPGPPSIAIECKANPNRDWDRTLTSAQLFRAELPCDEVVLVVPSLAKISSDDQARLARADVQLVPQPNLLSILQ